MRALLLEAAGEPGRAKDSHQYIMSTDHENSSGTTRRSFLVGSAAVVFALAGLTASSEESDAMPGSNIDLNTHPRVYLTAEDVQRARKNVAQFDWAKEYSAEIVRRAAPWLARPDLFYLQNTPKAGACFAYGFTGCPVCAADWGRWGSGIKASFDNPGHVTCVNGHTLPDAQYPDSGTGYVAPDGRTHFIIGTYNSWVIEQFTSGALESLVAAHTLTGDSRYAAKAAVLLDSLAAVYPTCDKGSWDYPSNPPSGRFNRPWYQVSRMLVRYTDFFDRIYHDPAMDAPSVKPALTRRENIAENLLKNGAVYCRDESNHGGLNNGEADYVRGSLAVGVCLGIPEYVDWALDGPYGIQSMLANNIDRDGQYFETSTMYSAHTRELYFSFAEPLRHALRIPGLRGADLYGDRKLSTLFMLQNLYQNCLGHTPTYGDSEPDYRQITPQSPPYDAADYENLERIQVRAHGERERSEIAAIMRWLSTGEPPRNAAKDSGVFIVDKAWDTLHYDSLPAKSGEMLSEARRRLTRSHFFGQKGLAILRAGTGDIAQALLVRFGPALNHAHRDDLNINYYANGYEATYDIGYVLGSTHTQVGWANQTVSHNLVVVDEQTQFGADGTGGSLHLFADLPGAQVAEVSSEASYSAQGVTVYRRTLALIDSDSPYLLDIFRVKGGKQHDYMLHALSENADFTGVDLGKVEVGSLAGTEINWAAKQNNDGDMAGHPDQVYWNPPPGNGYGFLAQAQRGAPAGEWTADWPLGESDAHLRATLAKNIGTEVITAIAPGLYPHFPKARYAIARRKQKSEDSTPLASEFIAAWEPYRGAAAPTSVERLPLTGPDSEISAVLVKVTRGETIDYVYSSDDAAERTSGDLRFQGRFIQIRVRAGQIASGSLIGAKRFAGLGLDLSADTDQYAGKVVAIDYETNRVTLDIRLPDDHRLHGAVVQFANPKYSRNTAYRVAEVQSSDAKTVITLESPMTLGRGQVGAVQDTQTLTSLIPHEYALCVNRARGTRFFDGKRIRANSGAETEVRKIVYGPPMTLTIDSPEGFKPGDFFTYHDVKEGDQFTIATTISLAAKPGGGYDTTGSGRGSSKVNPA